MMPSTTTPTPNASNVVVAGDGQVIVVEEGPTIVAQLLYAPPGWVLGVLVVLVGVVLALTALSLRRNELTDEVVDEMAENVLALFCCWYAAKFAVWVDVGPYLLTVAASALAGWVVAMLAARFVRLAYPPTSAARSDRPVQSE